MHALQKGKASRCGTAGGRREQGLCEMILLANRSEMVSRKIHKLPNGYEGIVVDAALSDYILRAVMEVLWIGSYILPVSIRKIIVTIHCAINMSPLPMIGETAWDL